MTRSTWPKRAAKISMSWAVTFMAIAVSAVIVGAFLTSKVLTVSSPSVTGSESTFLTVVGDNDLLDNNTSSAYFATFVNATIVTTEEPSRNSTKDEWKTRSEKTNFPPPNYSSTFEYLHHGLAQSYPNKTKNLNRRQRRAAMRSEKLNRRAAMRSERLNRRRKGHPPTWHSHLWTLRVLAPYLAVMVEICSIMSEPVFERGSRTWNEVAALFFGVVVNHAVERITTSSMDALTSNMVLEKIWELGKLDFQLIADLIKFISHSNGMIEQNHQDQVSDTIAKFASCFLLVSHILGCLGVFTLKILLIGCWAFAMVTSNVLLFVLAVFETARQEAKDHSWVAYLQKAFVVLEVVVSSLWMVFSFFVVGTVNHLDTSCFDYDDDVVQVNHLTVSTGTIEAGTLVSKDADMIGANLETVCNVDSDDEMANTYAHMDSVVTIFNNEPVESDLEHPLTDAFNFEGPLNKTDPQVNFELETHNTFNKSNLGPRVYDPSASNLERMDTLVNPTDEPDSISRFTKTSSVEDDVFGMKKSANIPAAAKLDPTFSIDSVSTENAIDTQEPLSRQDVDSTVTVQESIEFEITTEVNALVPSTETKILDPFPIVTSDTVNSSFAVKTTNSTDLFLLSSDLGLSTPNSVQDIDHKLNSTAETNEFSTEAFSNPDATLIVDTTMAEEVTNDQANDVSPGLSVFEIWNIVSSCFLGELLESETFPGVHGEDLFGMVPSEVYQPDQLYDNKMPPLELVQGSVRECESDGIEDLGIYGRFTKVGLLTLQKLHLINQKLIYLEWAVEHFSSSYPDVVSGLKNMAAVGESVFDDFDAMSVFSLLPDQWVDDPVLGYLTANLTCSCVGTNRFVIDINSMEFLTNPKSAVSILPPSDEYKTIVIPVNLGQCHWVLVVVDLLKRAIFVGDSLQQSGTLPTWAQNLRPSTPFGSIYAWLYQAYGKLKVQSIDGYPRQKDGVNCGIITLGVAEMLSRGINPAKWKWSAREADRYRFHLIKTILQGHGLVEGDVEPYKFV
ncbi:hypothetical protein HDU76_007961 [Blyttiomyces sp. JEL0837]|nr:hypothetical protein HDU76_007961 [Blyttiomyces sp. JEL0837]